MERRQCEVQKLEPPRPDQDLAVTTQRHKESQVSQLVHNQAGREQGATQHKRPASHRSRRSSGSVAASKKAATGAR